MYAKSMIAMFKSARAFFARSNFQHRLSYMPAVLVLAVAALPFTLGADHQQSSAGDGLDAAVEAPAESAVKTATAPTAMPEDRRYKVIADFMARKYRVSQDVVHDLVKTAHAVGRQLGIDPLLIVAVMAVESSFNPIAESVAGAKGLMQIIPKYHPEKFVEFGGEQSALDPRTNIVVGARIIREYLSASSGNLFTALQTYGGALTDRDAAYAHRVLNEKDKLDELSGLPKTNRSAHLARLDAKAVPQEGNRVSVTIPPSEPATATVPAPVAPLPAAAIPAAVPSIEPAAKPADRPTV